MRSWSIGGGYFGAIGDSMFESLRLYSFASLESAFDSDRAVEIASDTSDEIEYFLSEVQGEYSLFGSAMSILKTVAPVVNAQGGTVFLGSWGMGAAEIGWCIRYINDRSMFLRYLHSCRLEESDIDRYNLSYEEEIQNKKGA